MNPNKCPNCGLNTMHSVDEKYFMGEECGNCGYRRGQSQG